MSVPMRSVVTEMSVRAGDQVAAGEVLAVVSTGSTSEGEEGDA